MQGIHYCIITKTQIFYSHPTAFPSPSTAHITLVYLENKVFCDTTKKAMKFSPPNISFHQQFPGQMSVREAHLKNHNEHKDKSSESENAQESGSSKNLPAVRMSRNLNHLKGGVNIKSPSDQNKRI